MKSLVTLLIMFFALLCLGQGKYAMSMYNSVDSVQEMFIVDTGEDTVRYIRQQGFANFTMSNCILADGEGNPIFYSNGAHIYNKSGIKITDYLLGTSELIMTHGDLTGSVLEDAVQFVPPGQGSDHIVIHSDGDFDSLNYYAYTDLYISRLDGTNEIMISQNELIRAGFMSNFVITHHDNGSDYWMLVFDFEESIMYKYIISDDKVDLFETQFVDIFDYSICPYRGRLSMSPDGSKILYQSISCGLQVFDFDLCSGEISNEKFVFDSGSRFLSSTAEFSPDGQFVLASKIAHNQRITPGYKAIKRLDLYRTTNIGVSVEPDISIDMEDNFTPGRVLPLGKTKILILSRHISQRYYELKVNKDNTYIWTKKYFPFRYIPSKSLFLTANGGKDKCSSHTSELDVKGIKVYPNPVKDRLFIDKLKGGGRLIDIKISSISGRNVSYIYEDVGNAEIIQTQDWPPGMYIIHDALNSIYAKIIKI